MTCGSVRRPARSRRCAARRRTSFTLLRTAARMLLRTGRPACRSGRWYCTRQMLLLSFWDCTFSLSFSETTEEEKGVPKTEERNEKNDLWGRFSLLFDHIFEQVKPCDAHLRELLGAFQLVFCGVVLRDQRHPYDHALRADPLEEEPEIVRHD